MVLKMDESKKVEELEEFEGFKLWNHMDGEKLVKRSLGSHMPTKEGKRQFLAIYSLCKKCCFVKLFGLRYGNK
jgi:hypothetical protein